MYREGKPPELVTRGNSARGTDDLMALPFKERMQKTLYALECEQGSKFKVPGYSKDTLKKAWWNLKVRE